MLCDLFAGFTVKLVIVTRPHRMHCIDTTRYAVFMSLKSWRDSQSRRKIRKDWKQKPSSSEETVRAIVREGSPGGRCSRLLQMSHVAWSVGLCVGQLNVSCKNGWTDWDVIWGADLRVTKEPCTRWEWRSPAPRGNFGELSCPLKNICGVRSRRDHSVITNSTTSDAAFRQNSLTAF